MSAPKGKFLQFADRSDEADRPLTGDGRTSHACCQHAHLWHAFNILTFVIACAGLAVAVAKPSAPGATLDSSLAAWKKASETNVTHLQADVAGLQANVSSALSCWF